jgi:DNA-binding NarL/FixJ family response regulator
LERKNIFEIHTFNTGEAGIEQLHLNPDILILDYNLNRSGSRMNGREVMEVTKRQLQKARIIMLSGQEDGQLVLELIRQGIREYIVKGINSLDELDEILSMYMSEKA